MRRRKRTEEGRRRARARFMDRYGEAIRLILIGGGVVLLAAAAARMTVG
jgi:hypothetical protein